MRQFKLWWLLPLLAFFALAITASQSLSAQPPNCEDEQLGVTYDVGESYRMNSSWYGPGFHGNRTASGTIFNRYDPTVVAHKVLPFGTKLRITNPENGIVAEAIVRDDGPHPAGRHLDASEGLANKLGFKNSGVTPLKVTVIHIPASGKCRT